MDAPLYDALSRVCGQCNLAHGCCIGARPPLTQKRIDILLSNGVSPEDMEFNGYRRLRLKPDGFCVLFENGRCRIHASKPETCVAGPFTFDISGSILQIFLKRPSICPMVEFLKENREAYEGLFDISVRKIVDLVNELPPDELAEIVKIEEPQTDLVAEIKLTRIQHG